MVNCEKRIPRIGKSCIGKGAHNKTRNREKRKSPVGKGAHESKYRDFTQKTIDLSHIFQDELRPFFKEIINLQIFTSKKRASSP